ncbi:hypothetical protein F2Q70_00043969 [Brassica cretica]|uniref:Enhanced disease resistance 4-like N-terminal domain-containing protein n=1 Tax=Brassica cretica TaxID=69181 RepID=A0A8S9KI76_BRACR|nr:hypothetical protein F2Q70_00043969 [Brassica cretica]
MMKKKKHSRSQSSSKKTIEPSPDSSPSPSPRLLSIFRSKLVSGKDLKHMFRGMKTKTAPGLSSQSRIVRCPKCHKLLQEPIDATIYKCSGCNSILQVFSVSCALSLHVAKRWDLESNGDSIPEALLYSQNRSLSTQLESAEAGSKTPMRSTHREYNSRASPSVERGYDSETVYKHETSDVHREWMRRADEFSVTGESDAFASARSSPYNSRSNASEWTHHERRYQVPFYPASPSPSSAYEYGYNSPFHGSQASASEQSYYHHHQPNQFKQKEREGWFQESSAASPIRFPGETSNKNYYPSSASEEDANGRSSSSTDSTNDHEAVAHEEPSLMDENKFEELKVTLMVEDGPSLHLDKYGNDSTKLEDTFERTSERAPTFRLHEYELGTMLEPEEHPDGRSESSSTGSFNNHESSKLRDVFHEEEEEELQLHEMREDRVALDLKKGENGTIKLEETFERAPTFRLHDSELGTRLEPDEDADGRSESSSRGTFNDHVISKEREMDHEEDPRLVIDSRSKAQQEGEMAKDTVPLHLECENESMKLNETFKWTSERVLTFSHREHELGTMPEPDEDASESSLRGAFNDHGVSEERSVSHKDEPWLVEDYETKALKASVIADSGPSLHLEKCENVVLNQTVGPRDNLFRLSHDDTLEQERITFHLEKSQEKQVNLRQAFKQQGDTEDNIPASEGHESPCKMAEVDSEAEEDMLGDHLEHLQIENERSGLTSEPYSHFYNTTDPSEIVGLRLALYETQTSPLSSPMHTPTGSPLHILMRSPIASPMHTHIVSPMRSPINSSGSLSDVLFFGKKA